MHISCVTDALSFIFIPV